MISTLITKEDKSMSCRFQGSHPNTKLYIKLGEPPNITKTSKENEIKQYLKFLTISMCMDVLPLCMSVCHLWAQRGYQILLNH